MSRQRRLGMILLAGGVLLCTTAALPQTADEDLTSSGRASLESTIGNSAEVVRSGSRISWGTGDLGGTVEFGRAFSLASGEICSACSDPCRHVTYTVITARFMTFYEGTRCRQSTADGTALWIAHGDDQRTRRLASVPPVQPAPAVAEIPAPRVVAQATPDALPPAQDSLPQPQPSQPQTSQDSAPQTTIPGLPQQALAPGKERRDERRRQLVMQVQGALRALLYLDAGSDGDYDEPTQNALRDFIDDERDGPIAGPSVHVLDLLRQSVARSAQRRACPDAPNAHGKAYVGCGLTNGAGAAASLMAPASSLPASPGHHDQRQT
jgi:hypothetical protein